MRCEELMKKDVECIGPDDSVEEAACLMRDANIGFLPICDASKRVLGALTDRDIALRVVAENRAGNTKVGTLMTKEVVSCSPDDDIEHAQQLMEQNHKSRMIVVDDEEKLVGVISLSDIAVQEEGGRVAQTLRGVSEREARLH